MKRLPKFLRLFARPVLALLWMLGWALIVAGDHDIQRTVVVLQKEAVVIEKIFEEEAIVC